MNPIFLRTIPILPILLIAAGCGKTPAESTVAAKQPAQASDPNTIDVPETMKDQIKVGTLTMKSVGEQVTVAARIEVDGTLVTRVGSPVMGRVTALMVREGQQVKQGDLIALVSSTGLSDGQLAFLKALSQGQLAKRAVERARLLLKSEVIGAAEMQRREAELAQAEAERDAARDQLLLLGMPPEAVEELEKNRKLNSVARIVASMPGTVLSRKITLGQVVQPADALVEIADLSQVWLAADVPAPEAPGLFVGQHVEAEINNERISGKLDFVSATVNDATRTVRVHLELNNPKGIYKPAMLATMFVHGRSEPKPILPTTAVVRDENREYVFVQTAENTYQLRPVELGGEFGTDRVVLAGIRQGEKILLDGAFHLNNERRRRAVRGEGE